MSFLSALTPKAEMSFAEIVDEIHRLREENESLKARARPAAGATEQQRDADPAALAVVRQCLSGELAKVEASAERGRVQEAMAREELALRCEELGRALEQRVLQAEQAQHAAVAAAQQQSAAAVAALEEQLAVLSEEAAQREALADAYGADREVAEAEQRAMEAHVRAEHKEAELARLRRERDVERDEHAAALRREERKREAAEAAAAAAEQRVATSEGAARQLEGQLVRLSEGFNKQVEECCALQERLRAAKAAAVDKATARSWLVTFVEKGGAGSEHGEEMLRLMAAWWEFSPEDRQRVGLLRDRPHPDRESALHVSPDASLVDAFANFLDEQAEAN